MYVDPAEFRMQGVITQATTTTLPDEQLRELIERASRIFDLVCGVPPEHFESALYPVWKSSHVYAVGDIVAPTTPNSHKYRVTTAGTSAASEPVFPTGSGATVSSGTAVFTENGADVIATERVFYGDGSSFLKLDPFVPGTLDPDIAVPAGHTAPDFIERDGYLVLSSSGSLTHRFAPFPSFWRGGGWFTGLPITVTAKWGYEATPADVKHAVIELAANLWRETDPALVKLTDIDNQPLRENLPPRVREIARRYHAKQGVFV